MRIKKKIVRLTLLIISFVFLINCPKPNKKDPNSILTFISSLAITMQKTNNVKPFSLTTPKITSFSPSSGAEGTKVRITGTNFSTSSFEVSVFFNSTMAIVNSSTLTSILVTVPSGTNTGKILIRVKDLGEVVSNEDFIITPEITSFMPSTGLVGTTISIEGKKFSTNFDSNIVKFNGIPTRVTGAISTLLTVKVPIGATTGPITVSIGNETATSPSNFILSNPSSLIINNNFITSNIPNNHIDYTYFSATLQGGKVYYLSWGDSISGSSIYNGIVFVGVIKEDGITSILSDTFSGYYIPRKIIPSTSENIIIQVKNFLGPLNGSFGIKIGESLNWNLQNSATTNDLFGIDCPGKNTIHSVVVGSAGTIRKTSDGGNTWLGISSGTTNNLNSISCPSSSICFVTGVGGIILKSLDGGANWITHISNTSNSLTSIFCPSNLVCYAVGNSGTITKTLDSGTNWSVQNSGTTNQLNSIHCSNTINCIVVGNSGLIKKTSDGTNWSSQNSNLSTDLLGVYLGDNNNYLAINSVESQNANPHIGTVNGGNLWNPVYMGLDYPFYSISCISGSLNNCLVTGNNRRFSRSTSGLNSWTLQNIPRTVPNSTSFNANLCPTTNVCYAVGTGGVILKGQ